jgi:hypothetical protein
VRRGVRIGQVWSGENGLTVLRSHTEVPFTLLDRQCDMVSLVLKKSRSVTSHLRVTRRTESKVLTQLAS